MYIDRKIRKLFKILDPLDYKYSKYNNFLYKIFSLQKLIFQFDTKFIKINKNNDLEEKGFIQLKSQENSLNLILDSYYKLSGSDSLNDSYKASKKHYLKEYQINLLDQNNHIFFKFLFENRLLDIVKSYLGNYFTLNGAYFMYSENKHFGIGHSQELHLDGDALKQLKIFVHLSDVDSSSGPLHVLKKKKSKFLFSQSYKQGLIKRRSHKISDNKVSKDILNEVLPLLGPKGTINIVDTSNCYHFGSRPGNDDRLILLFQFLSSFSYKTRFFPNKDLIKNSDFLNEQEIKKINNIIKFSDFAI